VLKFAGAQWGTNGSIDFLPDAKPLSVVEKSAFADILVQQYSFALKYESLARPYLAMGQGGNCPPRETGFRV